jgi:choice-of-anchor A domain-containing protein
MNYAVAQGIAGVTTTNPNPARLVVGGKLTAQNGGVGSNQNGTIYYGTSAPSLTSFTARGGQVANQSLVNFSSAASLYTNYSAQLAGLAANGSESFNSSGNTLTFTGTASGLNVFTVSDILLSESQTINISAPTGSTVLINVTDADKGAVVFSNGSVNETGVTGAQVLYNIATATNVQLPGSKDPKGSILAPDAGVTGGFGQLSGQLIAGSYSGNTQFDDVAFTGTLPDPVPLPGAALLFGSGLLSLFGFKRQRAA